MTEDADTPDAPGPDAASTDARKRPGERLAKAIARAGLGSRREAEAWIEAGRVTLNGETVTTAAVNVVDGDRVEVDGRPLPQRERTRLWLYHKPRGYVTTTHDPEGRETVFSLLPDSMPRVMTIGRLDINTEGLLLLTNDGGLARVLELPETGWLRRYRVRAFGRTTPEALAALSDGVEIDGFAYGAIDAEIERQQSDNVWLRFGLREGKNREVKRVAEHLGLAVNRLIRISFGPFQLGSLPEGGIEEVRGRTLKDQLGKRLAEEAGCDFEGPANSFGEDAPRVTGGRGGARGSAEGRVRGERSRLADPSQRVGRRAPIARPRDMAAPTTSSEEPAERPARTKRAAAVSDRRGRTVKVERVSRDQADGAPKRVHRRKDGTAERFGAVGRPEKPGRSEKPSRPEKPGRPERPRREASPGTGRGRKPAVAGPDGGEFRRAPRLPGEVRTPGLWPPRGADGERRERGADRPRPPRGDRDGAPSRPRVPSERKSEPRWRDDASGEARPARGPRPFAKRDGDRPRRSDEDRPRTGPRDRERPFEGRASRSEMGERAARPRPPRAERPARDGAASSDQERAPRKPGGFKPRGEGGGRVGGGRPGGAGGKPRGPGGKPGGGKPFGGKPGGGGRGRPGGADRRR